jgi:hypothetical protein
MISSCCGKIAFFLENEVFTYPSSFKEDVLSLFDNSSLNISILLESG